MHIACMGLKPYEQATDPVSTVPEIASGCTFVNDACVVVKVAAGASQYATTSI